jgi:DMSO/TMAO reductase YedYZ molybdopterin-dependent catalytic subunit
MNRSRLQRHHRAGFLAGLIAGAIVTVAMYAARHLFNTFSLPELVSYRIIALIPLSTFSLMVETFGPNAKQILLVGTMIGQVVLFGLLGSLWASFASALPGEERGERRLPSLWNANLPGGLFFAIFLFVFVEILLFPAVGAGALGAQLLTGLGPNTAALAIYAAAFGAALAFGYQLLMSPAPDEELAEKPEEPPARTMTRRQVLVRSILGFAALVVGAGAVFGLTRPQNGPGAGKQGGRVGNGDLPPEITPTEAFYHVSKNFVDPKVEEAGWSLQIGGMVERPYKLTLTEIKAMPAVTDYRTLACISNEVGGDLISNAGWKGVRLKDLLEKAGVKPGAVDVSLSARDGYTESFPIEKALDPDVIAVYEMNSAPLGDDHGFPIRLLVPNIYGMKNVKWLTRVDVVNYNFQGFWQEQGWSDVATVQTMSRIDFPRSRQLLPTGTNRVGGVAFAGARGVKKVEVTNDNGKTWSEARLRRPLGPYTWVLWTIDFVLPEGEHTIAVRATDGTGETQTNKMTSTLPDGATGWHTVIVRTAPGVPAPSLAPVEDQAPAVGTPGFKGLFTP